MITGTEPQPERDKRHYQRALFDGIAERYEAFRPGYPAGVLEFVAATAGLGAGAATGGAWQRRPSDPAAVAATGLFGTPACLADERRTVLPAADVIALESTRATFLSWPDDTQRRFAGDLRLLLESQPTVHLTRRTSVTMAPVLRRVTI